MPHDRGNAAGVLCSHEDGSIEVDRNNALAIVELVDGAASRWGFLEARVLNIAYWRGETDPGCPEIRSSTYFFDLP